MSPPPNSAAKENNNNNNQEQQILTARRKLGDGGENAISVSVLGFGAGPLGGHYVGGAISDENALRTVRRALQLGINFFDTSPYYNNSEIVLGNALHKLRDEFPRSSYHICTKLGRYGPKRVHFDFSAERVRASIEESLRRLHTDYLDVVLCHDIEFNLKGLDQIVNETIPTLLEFKRRGIVRNVGVSGLPLDVLLKCAQMQQERSGGEHPLDVVLSYCHNTLHCTLLREMQDKFHAAGVKSVINASPLSMGLFTREGPPAWHPAPPPLKQAAEKCARICDNLGVDISKLAVKFSLEYDRVSTTLLGLVSEEEVEKGVAWCLEALEAKKNNNNNNNNNNAYDQKEREALEQVLKILEPVHNLMWQQPGPDD